MPLSPEKRQEIDAALTHAEGSRTKAAVLMGEPRKIIDNAIYNDPELRAKWVAPRGGTNNPEGGRPASPTQAPEQAVTLHRPAPANEEAVETARAMDKEDSLVREGLTAMGVSGKALDLVRSWTKLSRSHYTSCLQLIGGGITHQFISNSAEIEQLGEELAQPGLDIAREAMLRNYKLELLEIQGRTFDRANKAALTQAMIRQKMSGGAKGGKKPGYLAIQAQAGSKVDVHVDGEAGEA